jgi:flavin reductase (DIM6/NTAB) family NADH-FMN oxidoreductase RutF
MKRSLGAKTLLFPTPVLLVGTYDRTGKPNLMTAAWGGVCCSKPPCVAVSLRAATHSHGSIVERKAFTVGIASEGTLVGADFCGIASGRDVDKFAATGWTAVRSDLVDAPYAAESPVVLECRLLHTIELGLHTQFVGEIVDVKGNPEVCGDDGQFDILKIKPLVYDTARRGYHGVGPCLAQAFSVGKKLKGEPG